MSADFYAYVRGQTDVPPPGYTGQGLRVYRHLVYLGASQLVAAEFPQLESGLPAQEFRTLIEAFVRQSQWSSPYYGDLKNEFLAFLARETA